MTRQLATTKLSAKGQIVIPEEFRKKMGLQAGTVFIVFSEGDALIFKTIAPPPKKDVSALLAKIRKQINEAGLTEQDLNSLINEERKKAKAKQR